MYHPLKGESEERIQLLQNKQSRCGSVFWATLFAFILVTVAVFSATLSKKIAESTVAAPMHDLLIEKEVPVGPYKTEYGDAVVAKKLERKDTWDKVAILQKKIEINQVLKDAAKPDPGKEDDPSEQYVKISDRLDKLISERDVLCQDILEKIAASIKAVTNAANPVIPKTAINTVSDYLNLVKNVIKKFAQTWVQNYADDGLGKAGFNTMLKDGQNIEPWTDDEPKWTYVSQPLQEYIEAEKKWVYLQHIPDQEQLAEITETPKTGMTVILPAAMHSQIVASYKVNDVAKYMKDMSDGTNNGIKEISDCFKKYGYGAELKLREMGNYRVFSRQAQSPYTFDKIDKGVGKSHGRPCP